MTVPREQRLRWRCKSTMSRGFFRMCLKWSRISGPIYWRFIRAFRLMGSHRSVSASRCCRRRGICRGCWKFWSGRKACIMWRFWPKISVRKTLRNTKAAKGAAQEFLNVWKNAQNAAFFIGASAPGDCVIPQRGIMEVWGWRRILRLVLFYQH